MHPFNGVHKLHSNFSGAFQRLMQHVDEELPVLAALLRFVEGQRAEEQLLVGATFVYGRLAEGF